VMAAEASEHTCNLAKNFLTAQGKPFHWKLVLPQHFAVTFARSG
jgi:hypothetical protein